jgi:hypothetical protein
MVMSDDDIQHFLHYGYALPAEITSPVHVSAALARPLPRHADDLTQLVTAGVRTLNEALQDTWRAVASADHVVPISGGLDSRVILAWLAQHVDGAKVRTITFGVPGTYDYDIGLLVARHAGVSAEPIDLTRMRWSHDELLAFARTAGTAIPLFEAFLFQPVRDRFGREPVYWSGFLGESLAGSHLPRTPSASWDAARRRFARWKMPSVRLTRPHFDATARLPSQPLHAGTNAPAYDDQLDLAVRQQHYIAPLLLPDGYTHATPFTHPDWMSYSLHAPPETRRNAVLYRRVITTAFPQLFALPTKANHGLPLHVTDWRARTRREYVRARASLKRRYPRWFRGLLPTTNYLDFDEELRRPSSLRDVVHDALTALHTRGAADWLDIPALVRQHDRRERNVADSLLALASLELYLQAA